VDRALHITMYIYSDSRRLLWGIKSGNKINGVTVLDHKRHERLHIKARKFVMKSEKKLGKSGVATAFFSRNRTTDDICGDVSAIM
jgi:hypothetical protein